MRNDYKIKIRKKKKRMVKAPLFLKKYVYNDYDNNDNYNK